MFIAIFRHPVTNQMMSVNWKVGAPSPFKDSPSTVWNVGEVEADGQELEAIKINFSNVPIPNTANGSVKWYGDFAKFIAGNLPNG